MNVKVYSTISQLKRNITFKTIEDLFTWFQKQEDRTFYINFYEGDISIGFIPMIKNDVEETAAEVDESLINSISLLRGTS